MLREPVTDHPRLGQGERDEDADRVERDQRVGLAPEEHDEERGEAAQHENAVREDEPVALRRELARRVAVAGEQARQAREVGERSVGRQHEDQHC
jgi:hypothetical protein